MASLLVFLYLVIGIYYSSCYPLPALAPVVYPKQSLNLSLGLVMGCHSNTMGKCFMG